MASGQIHVACADAGGRWTVKAADGLAVLGFDSRRHRLRRDYDRLRRPVALFWRPENGPERLAEQTIYGEDDPDAMTANLRGRIHREHDGAGIATAAAYDFKGNLLVTSRQMTAAYRDAVDWLHETCLEPTVYASETAYDALNRPIALTAPDRSVVRPIYNRANLVERIDVSLKGRGAFAPYLRHVEYNARGQRVAVVWGNGVTTRRHYDPMTSWLRRLFTQRDDDEAKLQDLHYAYDPVGNVSSVQDDAWQAKFFRNQVVRANGDYVYDAVYRLVSATGREHVGRPGRPWTSHDDAGRIRLPSPGDGNAMQHYRENYRYDPVGNILEVVHSAPGDGSWRRNYDYESIAANNRLGTTRVGAEEGRYNYDANGNMTSHGPSAGPQVGLQGSTDSNSSTSGDQWRSSDDLLCLRRQRKAREKGRR